MRVAGVARVVALSAVIGWASTAPARAGSTPTDVARGRRAMVVTRAELVRPRAYAWSALGAQADPDTSLDEFLEGYSDSTDAYFGASAAARDTAGLDSALAYGLEHPDEQARGRRLPLSYKPRFSFNRVDGPVWGGGLGIGSERRWGQLFGEAGYASGPNVWLGGGGYRKNLRRGETEWTGSLFAGRRTGGMDRDHGERVLSSIRAIVGGRDRRHYLRRDGLEARIERETPVWRAGIGYRDMLESPLATTATWNFTHREPSVIDNLPAVYGRAREFVFETALRLPRVPITAQVTHHTSGDAMGSDFEYRRYRAAVAGEFGLGRLATAIPQAVYGRLIGQALPQESFYLGGSHSIRSLPTVDRGGTGLALLRLDLIGAADILELAHIPHPAMFPLQAGLFGAVGAVWGVDPYGGPAVEGHDWPQKEAWLSEVGAALLYRPGIPDPTGFFRINFAWALGPGRETRRWTVSYTRAIDLLRPLTR